MARPASPAEIASYFRGAAKDVQAVVASASSARIAWRGKEPVFIGLFVRFAVNVVYHATSTERVEDRLWLHFETRERGRDVALAVVRTAHAMTKGVTEPVYALCDERKFETAPRLLRMCGFAPVNDEIWGQEKIWQKLP